MPFLIHRQSVSTRTGEWNFEWFEWGLRHVPGKTLCLITRARGHSLLDDGAFNAKSVASVRFSKLIGQWTVLRDDALRPHWTGTGTGAGTGQLY